jgi:hypothetical protein
MLRILCVGLVVTVFAPGQAMTEMSAAAAGGMAGAAAGKPISAGLTAVFGKVDQLAKEAADDKGKDKEKGKEKGKDKGKSSGGGVLQMGPSQEAGQVPRAYSVPDPPPAKTFARRQLAPPAFVGPEPAPEPEVALQPVTRAPEVTLASIEPGMDHSAVAKVQSPAIRITMFDDGHLVEVYRYKEGVVRMTDGAVESVTLR